MQDSVVKLLGEALDVIEQYQVDPTFRERVCTSEHDEWATNVKGRLEAVVRFELGKRGIDWEELKTGTVPHLVGGSGRDRQGKRWYLSPLE